MTLMLPRFSSRDTSKRTGSWPTMPTCGADEQDGKQCGLGFRVRGLGFLGFRVQGSEFKVQGSGFRVQVLKKLWNRIELTWLMDQILHDSINTQPPGIRDHSIPGPNVNS